MDSVFNNSVYGNYGNGMMYGGPVQKDLTWTNAITPEEERALHKGTAGISLDIPKEDMYRAKCTHRDPATKRFTVTRNDDGSVTCLKCGARFNLVGNVNIDEIKRVIGGAIDILQTTKLAYIDMTPEVIQTYFVILPFLEIAPQLYEAAMHTLDGVIPTNGITGNYTPADAFGSLYSAVGNMGVNPAMMGQVYGMPPQQFMNPPTGAVPYAMNPMQTQGGYIMPGVVDSTATMQTAPAQQVQPQEGQTVQVGKKFKLD